MHKVVSFYVIKLALAPSWETEEILLCQEQSLLINDR